MRTIFYRNYSFTDKDPIIDAVRSVVKDEKLKIGTVHQITGVAATTIDNWFNGETRKPQNATVTQVTAALGYVRRDDLDRHGRVVVGFAKARRLDYRDEIEKQADWLLNHSDKRKKKRRRRNGRG